MATAPNSSPEGLPAPPWRRPVRRSTPPKRPVTLDLIVDTALQVVDAEGLDALSMRRIADELDTGPATLYGHIANKEGLLELALDRALGDVDTPVVDPDRWQDQLRELARSVHRALIGHSDLARASLGRLPTGPHALRIGESLLAIMTGGGLPPSLAAAAKDRILLYVYADAYEVSQYLARLREHGPAAVESFLEQVRDYLAGLPADQFPQTSAHAAALVSGSCDERFDLGLDLLVDGLAAAAQHPPDR